MASAAEPSVSDAGSPSTKRILIVGAGAIGGLLGVHLSHLGHTVTFFGRGAHLKAMQRSNHLRLTTPEGVELLSAPNSIFTGALENVSPNQDVIILALKMHQIATVAAQLPPLLSATGVYLTTQNGVPWWYFQRNPNAPPALRNTRVHAVDPAGILKDAIDPSRLLAAVVYPAAVIAEPGCIAHSYGTRFPVGELDGVESLRVRMVADLLTQAGFKSPVLRDVRAELWLKLWGTVAVNPLSALTHATLGELCDPALPGRRVVEGVMREVQMVAEKAGERLRLSMERRVEGARSVGAHRTSMLQDVERGRAMEVEGVMGAVVEIARRTECETPCLDAVYGTVSMLAWVLKERNAMVPLVEKV